MISQCGGPADDGAKRKIINTITGKRKKKMKRMSKLKVITLAMAILLFIGAASVMAAPWKFAVFCDSRHTYTGEDDSASTYGISPYFQNVALALSREKGIDFVLFPGDMFRGKKPTMTGAEMAAALDHWNSLMQPVHDAGIAVYAIRGNHDAYEVSDPDGPYGDAATIWRHFISLPGPTVNPITQDTGSQRGLTYAFMHKGSLFIGLDEYVVKGDYDRAFLMSQLKKKARHQFVFTHAPLWNYKADELGPAGLADDLNSGNVDLFFCGHIHSYQRIREAGYRLQEMIVGTAGAPQDDAPTVDPTGVGYVYDPDLTVVRYAGGPGVERYGYAVITVNDDGSITSTMRFLDDPASKTSAVSDFDAFTITKEAAAHHVK
jgi:predicted phosphodiesterase